MSRALLPDEIWEVVQPLLPKRRKRRSRHPGRNSVADDRTILKGILLVLRTGIPWQELPEEMGCSGMTCWRRFCDWRASGIWERLKRAMLERLPAAYRIDWEGKRVGWKSDRQVGAIIREREEAVKQYFDTGSRLMARIEELVIELEEAKAEVSALRHRIGTRLQRPYEIPMCEGCKKLAADLRERLISSKGKPGRPKKLLDPARLRLAIKAGRSSREIATLFGTSPQTARTSVHAMLLQMAIEQRSATMGEPAHKNPHS